MPLKADRVENVNKLALAFFLGPLILAWHDYQWWAVQGVCYFGAYLLLRLVYPPPNLL